MYSPTRPLERSILASGRRYLDDLLQHEHLGKQPRRIEVQLEKGVEMSASAKRERRATLIATAAIVIVFCLVNLYSLTSSSKPLAAFIRNDKQSVLLGQRISKDIDELARLVRAKTTADSDDVFMADGGAKRVRFSNDLMAALLSEIEAAADSPQQKKKAQPLPEPATDSFKLTHLGNSDGSNVHIVLSMSCGHRNRLLQQSVLQLSATAARQRGPITQILSGCSDEEREKVMLEPTFYYDFRRHFTPNFAVNPEPGYEDSYAAYNKPFGLRHFLLNANPPVKHEVLALIDGDFVFFRPLEANTGRDVSKYYHGSRDPRTVNDTVAPGLALAQDWTNILKGGLYAEERATDLSSACAGQTCEHIEREEAAEMFANGGPPYLMTVSDMKRMVDDYCHLCVTSRQVSKDWMTEMYAYSLAAANNGIQHTLLNNLGVTSIGYSGEGHEYWDFVNDSLPNPCEDDLEVVMPDDAPVSLHYCQFIANFYKGQLPDNATACDSPILKLFPSSMWTDAMAMQDEGSRRYHRHTVWARCTLLKTVNRALIRIKEETCPNGFNSYRGMGLILD